MRLFEVYNPDSIKKALQQKIMLDNKSKEHIDKLKEYAEAKSIREIMAEERAGGHGINLVEDDHTF